MTKKWYNRDTKKNIRQQITKVIWQTNNGKQSKNEIVNNTWHISYEKAVLYGEIMEINHYSPEIDAFLKVICFPTFWGHCGCILFHTYDLNVYGDDEPFR